MYHLAAIFPRVGRINMRLTRDQVMLLFIAVNEIFLGMEHYLAHLISGTIRPHEAIPIVFGPAAGGVLLLAGIIALRAGNLASALATITLLASIAVGLLGCWYHVMRAVLPSGPLEAMLSFNLVHLIVWAPPVLGPLTASLIGLLGISAAWLEDPVDSGRLRLIGRFRVRLPYSKTRAFFFMIGLGVLATLISSVLDHARTDFSNPWLWVPVAAGVLGTVVPVMLGMVKKPSRADLITYFITMLLLVAVGIAGLALHVQHDLTAQSQVVPERFIRGAPFMAPMLFSDMGVLGLVILLDPRGKKQL
ncbi:MAG: hypothetical protein ABIJ56_00280 [Pseudomonadota bacterium]